MKRPYRCINCDRVFLDERQYRKHRGGPGKLESNTRLRRFKGEPKRLKPGKRFTDF